VLFSLASSSFVALSLLPSTLRAARSHLGSVGAFFPAIEQDQLAMAVMIWWGYVPCSFSLPFLAFPPLLFLLPALCRVHRGPIASSDACWPGRQRSRAHVCGWAMCRVCGHCDWWTWWWFQNVCEGVS